jgi:ABC-type nitrate/sulfonate/bicarbonate transport system substrate-binding protein
MRTFPSGATRDSNEGKPDYFKSLSPLVLQRFGQYMLKHNIQADGAKRELDNWKRGIPPAEYVASLGRHVLDLWLLWEGYLTASREADVEESLCALLFNAQGLLHTMLLDKQDRT